ncbi:MAG TPA: GNAT family N-acetyltransferase [archaeon]|nr:GNAT family N-acetyltransferase [archaeon]
MGISIRQTRPEDFNQIAGLLEETGIDITSFTEEKFMAMLERCREYCFVAEDKGKITGTVFGVTDGAFIGYIRRLVVTEGCRGQGIGKKLAEAVFEKFGESSIPLIFANVKKTNEPSLNLFKKLGFEVRDSHYLVDRVYEPK